MAAAKLLHARRVGAHLRRIREARGLTATFVAERAGFTQQQISRVEGGKINIPIETLAKIANALGIPLKECMPDSWEFTLPASSGIFYGGLVQRVLMPALCVA